MHRQTTIWATSRIHTPARHQSLAPLPSDPHVRDPATPEPSLPFWVRAADVTTIVLSVVVMHVAVFGPLRLGSVLSIGEPWRALLLLGFVAGLRHYLVRTQPVHQRVWARLRSGWRTDAAQAVWPIVVVTRLAVLLVGYLAVASVGYPPGAPPIRVSDNEAANLPMRWDTGWYLNIALEGYQWSADIDDQQNVAFFPGYPLLTRGVATLIGAQSISRGQLDRPSRLVMRRYQQRFITAAMLITFVGFGWGMVFLYRLAREHLDPEATRASLLLLATYPFAVFFSAAYTESLMLLAVVAAFYHFRHEKWIAAAGWGLLAGLTRPNGFLLAGPLAVIGLRQLLARRASVQAGDLISRQALIVAGVAAMPLVGTLIYSGFIYWLTGDPLAWREAHTAWGRSYTGFPTLMVPLGSITERGLVEYTTAQPIEALNAVGAILACALIWPITRRLGPEYGLFMILNVGPPLIFGGFLSMGRVTSLLFPMFMYLALVLADRQRQTLAVGFAVVQGLAAVLFFTWHQFL
jgi:hypothetical protein